MAGRRARTGPKGAGPERRPRRAVRPSRLIAAALAACATALAPALGPARAADAPFSDAELIEGFVLTVFGSEAESARNNATSNVVKKFTGPVSFTIVATASVERRRTVRAFLRSLSESVAHLTLRETAARETADLVIYLMDRRDYAATIRRTVWPGVDTAFLEDNHCSAVIAARRTGIERANIYLVADEGFIELSHCLVEEVAQSLGPANDSPFLSESIFNDASSLNVFGLFDWFILNMLYDPRVQPGMTEEEVRRVLPAVLADVRGRMPELVAGSQDVHMGSTVPREPPRQP